jgi:hypothetical protein
VRKVVNLIGAGVTGFWLLLAACNPSVAQGASSAASDPEYQALFQRMYANPRNLEVTFKFAEVATRLGDYEAAIGALERMLFYNPNLPRVKLELGVLYYKMGGYQVSRSYLDQVRKSRGTPPEVLSKVDELVATIDRGGASGGSPTGFTAFVWAGARYQTNANAGASSLIVRSLGQDATLDSAFGKAPDWNKFIFAVLGYSYNLGGGNALEASFLGYYAKQERISRVDLGLAELTVGPRFALPFRDASWKIYGIGTVATLAQLPYFSGVGAGVSTRFNLGDLGLIEPSYEHRNRRFTNSDIYTTVSQQSGKLRTAALTSSGTFGKLPWYSRSAVSWHRTDDVAFDFNTYTRWSSDIGFPIPFTLNGSDGPHQFFFTPAAGYSRTSYAQPNPLIDPAVARSDREWHASGTLDGQIYSAIGFRTQVQYTRTSSNLPNFSNDNFAVSFGPTGRF